MINQLNSIDAVQECDARKLNYNDCTLSPAGGGSTSIYNTFQVGVDLRLPLTLASIQLLRNS